MKLNLIQDTDVEYAKEKLVGYYANNLIPAEKKQYLTDLKQSHGPYMGITAQDGSTHYMMDAASQIATLGLGFNSNVFFGPSQFLESWTNNNNTPSAESIRTAFEAFLKRKTGWKSLFTTFCNSGAEANEIALGYCYRNRKNKKAKKVLAFEGSFHGRMMVSLQATWNPSKREPFLIPGHEAIFCKFPELNGDNTLQPFPDSWLQTWEQSTTTNFSTPSEWDKDDQLLSEINSLKEVRTQLLNGNIFSIIVEPMQCEGGDRYSSSRFNSALLVMAKSFDIQVIHDEVQTGFHLGSEFFWHRMFNLKDTDGSLLTPDYVICAKKAQVGIVLSHTDEVRLNSAPEEFSMVSMTRGYFHGVSLDQAQLLICKIEADSKLRLNKLIEKYSKYISRPRAKGLSFAFDLNDKSKIPDFIAARFDHGLLYYPAGDKTLRFRLNTAFKKQDLDFLFCRLEEIILSVLVESDIKNVDTVETVSRRPENLYQWYELLTSYRLLKLQDKNISNDKVWLDCKQLLTGKDGLEDSTLIRLTKKNFTDYQDDIIAIQKEIYEPTRQTDLKTFRSAVEDNLGISLLLIKDKKIQAMAISGKLSNFPNERVLKRDNSFSESDNLYMVDCTVRVGNQGHGIGRQLKSALNLIAMSENKNKIVGRNRDKLAGAMLSINLGLGAREELFVEEDYLDEEDFRDVFYYNNELQWSNSNYRLDNGVTSLLTASDIDTNFIKDQLPFLANKVCLSNFVSIRYLDQIKELFSVLPEQLRHGYSASGQSECVDKLSKSMFVADTNRSKMISFKGHFFGLGSFMSRDLGQAGESYYDVETFDSPNEENWKDILKQIIKSTDPSETLAVWLEPLPQNLLTPLPLSFLKEIRKWTKENNINLVFNDTASSLYRYDQDQFCASAIEQISPDAGFIFMGGQAALVFVNEENFMSKPLMMISTWDGDEFSYASYTRAVQLINEDKERFLKIRKEFSIKLESIIKENNVTSFNIHNGSGTIEGDIPKSLSKLMTRMENGKYKFLPSYGSMKLFLKDNK